MSTAVTSTSSSDIDVSASQTDGHDSVGASSPVGIATKEGKSLECPVCGKVFSRSDSLKRHVADLHSDQPHDPPEVRRRSRACEICAKQKVRCDVQRPRCARCTRKGLDCVYINIKPPRTTLERQSPPANDEDMREQSVPDQTALDVGVTVQGKGVQDQTMNEYGTGTHLDPFFGNGITSDSFDLLNFPFDLTGWTGAVAQESSGGLVDLGGTPFPLPSTSSLTATTTTNTVDPVLNLQLDTDEAMFWADWGSLAQSKWAHTAPVAPVLPPQPLPPNGGAQSPGERVGDTEDLSKEADANGEEDEEGSEEDKANAPNLVSRAGSPGLHAEDEIGKAISAWPIFYNPNEDTGSVFLGRKRLKVGAIPTEDEDATSPFSRTSGRSQYEQLISISFSRTARSRILEAVLFGGLSEKESQSIYRTLGRLDDNVYTHFISLYFLHFHPQHPFLHKPTFSPDTANGLLTLAVIAVGAIYSSLEGAQHLGRVLLEVVRRAGDRQITHYPSTARNLEIVQAFLLFSVSTYAGGGRELEIYERYRTIACVLLRRLLGFVPLQIQIPEGNHELLLRSWTAWIKWEQLRRTALVCFALETDGTTLLRQGLTVRLSELELAFPCAEELWDAQDALSWHSLYVISPNRSQVRINTILTEFSSTQSPTDINSLALSPFGAYILSKALLHSTHTLHELRMISPSAVTTALADLDVIQRNICSSDNVCIPSFVNEANETSYAPALLNFHAAVVTRYARMAELMTISGKETKERLQTARAQLGGWMTKNASSARLAAIAAGQVIRIARDLSFNGPEEGACVFASAIYLYVFARSRPFNAWSSPLQNPILLDHSPSEDPASWIQLGSTTPELTGIGPLNTSDAPKLILQLYGTALQRNSWQFSRGMGQALLNMAIRESSY
ncbi:hypothetical protein T439DRAFT_328904 [Meredithblackwellia eburnea MCA 4105]